MAIAVCAASNQNRPATFHPLDVAEEVMQFRDWDFHRMDEDILFGEAMTASHRWPVQFLWRADADTVVFACNFTEPVTAQVQLELQKLLVRINDNLMTGYFNYSARENMLSYRNSLLVRGQGMSCTEQIQDMLDFGVHECERYAVAFDLLLRRKMSAEVAWSACLFETVGQA